MAKNTGEGGRKGMVTGRYQQENPRTNRFDKFDGSGNYLSSKKSEGPYKGVETRQPKKPPRG
ncbi:hypothetical protein ACFVAJ_17925 [Agromyces sp. NPDC057679]|uniref:hypothetical protein n=1 Tax=Agromyces sp. NPDC057679 TaxID=3346207 RepID=UPI00366D4301